MYDPVKAFESMLKKEDEAIPDIDDICLATVRPKEEIKIFLTDDEKYKEALDLFQASFSGWRMS